MNRALVVQSFFPELAVQGVSDCEDVTFMQAACSQILSGDTGRQMTPMNAGEGGTTLRFLLSRMSRIAGDHFIHCHHRLLERPHEHLIKALSQMGVRVIKDLRGFRIESNGWALPSKVVVDGGTSSQYASSLLLSAWGLSVPLVLDLGDRQASRGYLDMTIKVLKHLGMEIQDTGKVITVPASQTLGKTDYSVEPDMSSIFAIACFAGLCGDLEILNFPNPSMQPDVQFLEIFKDLGIPWSLESETLKVGKAQSVSGGKWSLENTPDIFPVFAVLLTQASCPSTLTGLRTLAHKESDRIQSLLRVLKLMGASCEYSPANDQFWIGGRCRPTAAKPIAVDPAADHRVAMAITLAQQLGFPLELQNPGVVRKSFPHFFEIVGGPHSVGSELS